MALISLFQNGLYVVIFAMTKKRDAETSRFSLYRLADRTIKCSCLYI